ncbi:hypothetical protein OB2597_11306 [Pseudooceanicola batsensis HTCC2597]|uniref:LytTR family transcriptional regulator n=1 Tax=Pseudooceanicola batsensis (strain ATCC BAA-863 / DSM 15984 / KCTC 12145 / HTCC2597) TaxID=252305 RepID=A3TW31_PSEBH|nr:DUF4159 domain-containing protein [Pseudooceanicola batsensis]EAQ03827.1 hypothetical protein OB2597_11306 [Pseudooceanicola batsensis HTCC2597]
MTLGPIGFAAPWLLIALAALPILWLLLRAVPPAPIRRRFPGVALLLGLTDDEAVSDRTPWWLLLLRMLAVAAVIVGLAGPILNPQDEARTGRGPLLVLLDGSWASARNWDAQSDLIDGLLAEAGRQGRTAAFQRLTTPEPPVFRAADTWRQYLPGLTARPWEPSADDLESVAASLPDSAFDTYWLSDGLARDGRQALLAALESRGTVTVYESPRPPLGLRPVTIEDGALAIAAIRPLPRSAREITVQAMGRDPAGTMRTLANLPLAFADGETEASGALSLPAELRARVTHLAIAGERTAGATTLSDDSFRRREVALIGTRQEGETLDLLSPLHYLRKALVETVDLIEGPLTEMLPANPDVVVMADVASLSALEEEELLEWAEEGGLLLRFAGPRLAASDVARDAENPLLPTRLRAGGRNVGGAMSWGEPKTLAPFDTESPFEGLEVPDDVTVSSQVMAQPDPSLSERVIARLSDGTPLVTRKTIGQGQVVLFHVTANAEWSTLPLSGLFVQMLERLSVASGTARPEAEDLEGTTWQATQLLTADGRIERAGTLPGVPGERLIDAALGPNLQPGLYQSGDRTLARNVLQAESTLAPVNWPARLRVEGMTRAEEQPLGGWLLALSLILLTADILATLALSGRLSGPRAGASATAVLLALALVQPGAARAQEESDPAQAIQATAEVVLAHVVTGNRAVDDLAHDGLRGLSQTLNFRTSVEPAEPMAVDLETDELAFYPFLYWPVTPDQPIPSDVAYQKLNRYLRTGGMILFDTRDADVAGFGTSGPNGRKLQALAAPLDIPALEPVPEDHVLTRTFYLLRDFPGRHLGRDVWVEAAPPDAELVEGMPFRNLNDGVTPVVIGGNDWAAAWAVDDRGAPLVPIGRGYAGERQREIAYRFGVNLIMHVLTGNYKSDQVHVPALLDRLGQ